ncbi:hypothetical protein SOMG_00036 [Schizosaccharomyces osmophilus]|uniref:Uncharacterized protein n=1 Tax=Schizosaccharomyces osmophilus TaxID=2545709 RepID=A0AAE9WBW4_9SCHI|nr:uncharacterized protein SOMG_00036 [Schizosaccharomyces osmophilus]WBW72387.1 hypothetical protein SOMG_00036 [Schizosaccharomyces osmophilus]
MIIDIVWFQNFHSFFNGTAVLIIKDETEGNSGVHQKVFLHRELHTGINMNLLIVTHSLLGAATRTKMNRVGLTYLKLLFGKENPTWRFSIDRQILIIILTYASEAT